MSKLRVLDLFAGIAGISLGLHRSGGFETVQFVEINEYAGRVLNERFPGVPIHQDVTTYEFKEGEADVVTAGFPCQDLSFAGNGAGLSGERSGLYREVVRALRVVRPAFAVLENVAALLSRGMGTVLGDMAEVGYDAEWHCIPASAVGAPHRRDRVWIVANPCGEQHEGGCAPLSGEIAAELSQAYMANAPRERCAEAGQFRHQQPEEWFAGSGETLAHADRIDAQGLVAGLSHPQERSRQVGRQAGPCRDGFGWWAVEPDVGRVAHGVPARVDRLERLGNAVVPQIPEAIGRAILASRVAA